MTVNRFGMLAAALVLSTSLACSQDSLVGTNTVDLVPELFPAAPASEWGTALPGFDIIADRGDGLSNPTDLDFHTGAGRDYELWITNTGTPDTGGETPIIFDASFSTQRVEVLKDGNSWHFMSMPSALAFNDNEDFAVSPNVQDANHADGNFTGPALFDGDLDIYASGIGINGDHLDMLHGSPFSMGIAADTEPNAYWLFDGYERQPRQGEMMHSELVYYDFVEDHGPGNADHSDGRILRYHEVRLTREPGIPSHMILNPVSGMLYIAHTSASEVLWVDTFSGRRDQSELPRINEPLAEHVRVSDVDWGVLASNVGIHPSGIALSDGRLFVGDQETGVLYVLDELTGDVLTTLETNALKLGGIVVGPEGFIWFVDSDRDEVMRILPQVPSFS